MRIILADHHSTALWALRMLVLEQPEYELVGEVESAQSLLRLTQIELADLVLVDKDLPGMVIEDLFVALHELEPRPVVVAMTSQSEYGRLLLRAGADAFVSKSDQPDWLLAILNRYAGRPRPT